MEDTTSIETTPEITNTNSTTDQVMNGIAVAAASAVVYVVMSAVTKYAMEKVAKKIEVRRAKAQIHVVN